MCANRLILFQLAILLRYNGVCNRVEALASADLLDQMGDLVFWIVEDGLDQGLQGRVARLEVVNVLFVDAFAPMIGVEVIDTFGVVYSGTGGTGWSGAVALGVCKCTFSTASSKQQWQLTRDVPLTCASDTAHMRWRCTASSSHPRWRRCHQHPSYSSAPSWASYPRQALAECCPPWRPEQGALSPGADCGVRGGLAGRARALTGDGRRYSTSQQPINQRLEASVYDGESRFHNGLST